MTTQLTATRSPLDVVTAPRRIVVCVPDGPVAPGPLTWVAQRVRRLDIPVLIVHAWTPRAPSPETEGWLNPDLQVAATAQPGAEAAAWLRRHGVEATVQTTCDGASEVILSVLQPTDEAVLGTVSDRPMRHAFFAHVVHSVLRGAPGVVVVVPDNWQPLDVSPETIVVSHDGTRQADAALEWAVATWAGTLSAIILDRTSVPGHPMAREREADGEFLARARRLAVGKELGGVTLHTVTAVRSGTAADLDETARGAAAIVLGNHRASLFAGAAGRSITELATYHSPCPVVLVPSP